MGARNCDECKYNGSWHVDPDTGRSWRCPNYLAAELHTQAERLSSEAKKKQREAVKKIIEDKAQVLHEFSANKIRGELEAAQIYDKKSVIGPAFLAASKGEHPIIRGTGRYEPSDEETTRHQIQIWESLICRRAAS